MFYYNKIQTEDVDYGDQSVPVRSHGHVESCHSPRTQPHLKRMSGAWIYCPPLSARATPPCHHRGWKECLGQLPAIWDHKAPHSCCEHLYILSFHLFKMEKLLLPWFQYFLLNFVFVKMEKSNST